MSEDRKVPAKWRSAFNSELRHTVQILQDGDTEIVVSKVWSSGKQRWIYRTETMHDVMLQIRLMSREDK